MQTITEYRKNKKKTNLIVIVLLLLVLIGGAIGLSCYLTNGFKPTNKNISNTIATEKYGTFELSNNAKFGNNRSAGVFFESNTNFSAYKDLILEKMYKENSNNETKFLKEDTILAFDLGDLAEYYLYKSSISVKDISHKEKTYYLFENDTLKYDSAIERLPFQLRLVDLVLINTKSNEYESLFSNFSFVGEYFETEFEYENEKQLTPCIKVINSNKNIPLSELIISNIINSLEN